MPLTLMVRSAAVLNCRKQPKLTALNHKLLMNTLLEECWAYSNRVDKPDHGREDKGEGNQLLFDGYKALWVIRIRSVMMNPRTSNIRNGIKPTFRLMMMNRTTR